MKTAVVVFGVLAFPALLVLASAGVSCRGCPPAPPIKDAAPTTDATDADATDVGSSDAPPQSSAVLTNRTPTPTVAYVSFGSNNQVDAASWPFCGDAAPNIGCAIPLDAGASQLLPTEGVALNVTVAFDQYPACNTTLAEFNLGVPGWGQDTANISLVNGWSNNVEIDVTDAATLGPTQGPDANADVYGVYPVACDICVARSSPPCQVDAAGCTTPGSCGCKSGTQYNPTVPCQESFARGSVVTVALVSH